MLWRFNNLAHYSTGVIEKIMHPVLLSTDPGSHQYVPVDNGQLFWADGFYVKVDATPTSDASLSLETGVAGAILASQWRLWDLTLEMIRKTGDSVLLDQLKSVIKPGNSSQNLSQIIASLESRNRELEASVAALRKELAETNAAQAGLND